LKPSSATCSSSWCAIATSPGPNTAGEPPAASCHAASVANRLPSRRPALGQPRVHRRALPPQSRRGRRAAVCRELVRGEHWSARDRLDLGESRCARCQRGITPARAPARAGWRPRAAADRGRPGRARLDHGRRRAHGWSGPGGHAVPRRRGDPVSPWATQRRWPIVLACRSPLVPARWTTTKGVSSSP